jgi:hypothetical protein
MPLQVIHIGNIANDGTGDDLRDAFIKVNDNFELLYESSGDAITGLNVGSTGQGIFKQKSANELQFRKIDVTAPLTISLVGDVVTVNFSPSSAVNFNGQNITNVGTISATTISGSITGNITGNVTGNLTGNVTGLIRSQTGGSSPLNYPFVDTNELNNTVNTFDYGTIDPTFTDPVRYLLYVTGTDMGTIASPASFGIDAGDLSSL